MAPFKEVEVALNALVALERRLKNPGGPVEQALARYAVRVAIVSVEAIAQLEEDRELAVTAN